MSTNSCPPFHFVASGMIFLFKESSSCGLSSKENHELAHPPGMRNANNLTTGIGNQNSGWATDNNNWGASGWDNSNNNGANNGGWDNGGDNSGGNGEQKPSSDEPPVPFPSKPASAANDLQANSGYWDFTAIMSKAGSNKATHDNDWGKHNNSPLQGQGINNRPTDVWEGPPGSKPPSDHPSRRGSKGNGGFRQDSPPGQGAFAWPENTGPPPNTADNAWQNANGGGFDMPPAKCQNGWEGQQSGGWGGSQKGAAP